MNPAGSPAVSWMLMSIFYARAEEICVRCNAPVLRAQDCRGGSSCNPNGAVVAKTCMLPLPMRAFSLERSTSTGMRRVSLNGSNGH